jgi:hypothetical protein
MLGLPLVALGRSRADLPSRDGVKGVGNAGELDNLQPDAVLEALGLG